MFWSRRVCAAIRSEARGPTVTALRELSARHGVVLVAGFNETSGQDRPYNSAVVIDRGELPTGYRKTHPGDREKLLFTPGDQPPPVVSTSVGRVGLVVCYDLEFPEVTRRLALEEAQIVVAPAAVAEAVAGVPELPR